MYSVYWRNENLNSKEKRMCFKLDQTKEQQEQGAEKASKGGKKTLAHFTYYCLERT